MSASKEIDCKWTDEPVCPHCGKANYDWWDGCGNVNDGDSWQVECRFCENPYTITMVVETSFETKIAKEKGDEK